VVGQGVKRRSIVWCNTVKILKGVSRPPVSDLFQVGGHFAPPRGKTPTSGTLRFKYSTQKRDILQYTPCTKKHVTTYC